MQSRGGPPATGQLVLAGPRKVWPYQLLRLLRAYAVTWAGFHALAVSAVQGPIGN
jgi:hypothetical protein